MRKLLLPLWLLAATAAPASSAIIEGGDLIVQNQGPFDQFAVFGTDAIVGAYSNITTFFGTGITHGGATVIGLNTLTALAADDLVPVPLYGGVDVTSFKFTTVNFNPGSVTYRPLVRFWLADGAGGGPGTLYTGFNFNAITQPGLVVTTLTATLPPAAMPMLGVPFWAGVTFDNNNGATGATVAQMNNLGQGVFNPPTVGSSADQIFVTLAAGSFAANNPAGVIVAGNGQVPYNFGWEFNVDNATPTQASSWGRLKALYR